MDGYYQIFLTLIIITVVAAALLVVKKVFFSVLRHVMKDSALQVVDFFEKGLQVPLSLLILLLAIYIALRFADLPTAYGSAITTGMYLSFIVTLTMGLANVSDRMLDFFLRKSGLPISVTGLLLGVTKATIYAIGFLIALNYLGFSITPIITALGVGGLAMALALQDTLSNLFAGMHILAEQTVRVGDFIRLETGQEGHIVDIGWRTTRIRTLASNMVIVPNSKLSQSVVTNFYLPERTIAIQLSISVHTDTDPAFAECVLLDEAKKAVLGMNGVVKESVPTVFFSPGFGASSLDFTLSCHAQDVLYQQPVLHELRKRIYTRLKQEGIKMPFPTQTICLQELPVKARKTGSKK